MTGFILAFAGPATAAFANNAPHVTRGPYLQLLTSDSVVIRWRTDQPAANQVLVGKSADRLDRLIGDVAPRTEHEVRVAGLKPATQYYYHLADTREADVSETAPSWNFITAPRSGETVPIHVWVLGDSGTANTNAAAVRDAYERFNGSRHTDFWLMLGDNAYTRGTDLQYQKAVFEEYPTLLGAAPLWPTLGNHDCKSCDPVSLSGVYFDIFTLPTRGQAGGIRSCSDCYYSFDYGNAHFICLDSNQHDFSDNNPMFQWLRNDLRANHLDWTVAFFHHPPYTRGAHDSDNPKDHMHDVRERIVPLLEAGGVDLVLSGHSHSYERSFLLDGHTGRSETFCNRFKLNAGNGQESGQGVYRKSSLGPDPHKGTVYVVAGSSGQASGGRLNHPAMCFSTNSLGSLILDINSNRLDATFINEQAEALDHFTIIKGESLQTPTARASKARSRGP